MSNTGLGDLTPAELQILMQILQGQQAPGVFGGDYGPSMDPAGLDLTGYTPVNIPQLTTKGKVDPYDLSQAQQRLNLEQDIYGSLNDPMLGALGGPGAFGPDAFQPTYDYGEPLNLVGRKKAQQYLDTGGYQGYIADAIMNKGMGPDEAAQSALDLAMNTDLSKITDPKQKALIQSLQKSLPQATQTSNALGLPSQQGARGDLPGGRKAITAYDTNKVTGFATSLFEDIARDPSFAYQDEAGNYYAKTPEQAMQKTEQMKAFDKAGLPYMTDQYSDPGYIDKAIAAATGRNTEGQQSAEQSYMDQMAQMMGEHELSGMRQRAAREGMDTLRPFMPQLQQQAQPRQQAQPSAMLGPPAPGQPGNPSMPRQAQPSAMFGPPAPGQPGNPSRFGDNPFGFAQGPGAPAQPAPMLGPPAPGQPGNPSAPQVPPDVQAMINRVLKGGGNPLPGIAGLINYVGPSPDENQPGPAPSPGPTGSTPTTPLRPLRDYQRGTPPRPLFYVDADGNIVPAPEAPPLRPLRDYQREGSPTQRPAKLEDMARLQAQYDRENQANTDFYQRQGQMLKQDPLNDRIRAVARAQALAQAGRTPTRDALMQRMLAQRAMGFGQ
jgi:hypothetical protein